MARFSGRRLAATVVSAATIQAADAKLLANRIT
jgi:hypothetical protein